MWVYLWMFLNDVSDLKGVGPKLLEKLNKCGIFTIIRFAYYIFLEIMNF